MGFEFWVGVGVTVLGMGLRVAKIEHRGVGISVSVIGVLVIAWALISKREPVSPAPVHSTAISVTATRMPPTERPRPTGRLLRAPTGKDSPVAPPTTTPKAAPTSEPTAVPLVTCDYQGTRRISRGKDSYKEIGPEAEAYWRMWDLAKTDDVCHWMALRDFAESEMRKVPDWITPQIYLGIAYLHLGEVRTGDRLLESAQRRIGNNPDYVGMLPMIEP